MVPSAWRFNNYMEMLPLISSFLLYSELYMEMLQVIYAESQLLQNISNLHGAFPVTIYFSTLKHKLSGGFPSN
jgi:hypothetical protein